MDIAETITADLEKRVQRIRDEREVLTVRSMELDQMEKWYGEQIKSIRADGLPADDSHMDPAVEKSMQAPQLSQAERLAILAQAGDGTVGATQAADVFLRLGVSKAKRDNLVTFLHRKLKNPDKWEPTTTRGVYRYIGTNGQVPAD